MIKLQRSLALTSAAILAASLGACSGGANGAKPSTASPAGQTQTATKNCVSKVTPAKPIETKVTPVEGEVPAISAGTNFGEKPTIAEGAGNPPTKLIRKTLIKGNGPALTPLSEVKVNYLGKLWQGGVFDNSYDRGEPTTFSLQGVVGGWTWGLNGAHVGDRVELVIPPELGYPNGSGDKIPPGSTLVFVVDIVGAPFTPPQHDEAGLTKLTEQLKQSAPIKAALPAGLEIGCEAGQEPKLSFQKGSKAPNKPEQVWLSTGKGRQITEDDYVGYLTSVAPWSGEAKSNWTSGTGIEYTSAKDTIFVGKTVGSRLVVAMPPQNGDTGMAQVIDLVEAIPGAK